MLLFKVKQISGKTIMVILAQHKDGSGYSYINLTKGHICPCKFNTIDDAINDMRNNPRVIEFTQI